MRTVAVTFGNGRYKALAAAFTDRWNKINTDFPCMDLSDKIPWDRVSRKPGFGKAYIWDVVPEEVDRIVFFDADSIPVRPVSIEKFPDVPFAAVDDNPTTLDRAKAKFEEMRVLEVSFNSGFFTAKRETRYIFDKLKDKQTNSFGLKFEQFPFNLLVKEHLGGYTSMPLEYNWRQRHAWRTRRGRPGPHECPYVIHFAGAGDYTILKVMYTMFGDDRFDLDTGF